MIISSILLLSNGVTLRRDKSILYSGISMTILIYSCLIGYNNLDFSFLENGIRLFGGLLASIKILKYKFNIIKIYYLEWRFTSPPSPYAFLSLQSLSDPWLVAIAPKNH